MRLLNASTLKLKDFNGDDIPEYAILSHTWGQEEVLFEHIKHSTASKPAKGFQKVRSCCEQALQDGYAWVWVDTCCIDKSSSAELSEAINSMYRWYQNSSACYAYLADVHPRLPGATPRFEREFKRSRWFTRGWTLQELIAPDAVVFYAADWSELGTKSSLNETISSITRIDAGVLRGTALPSLFCVAERMSWAAGRKTTRREDRAYSLLGLFDVNMPALYGEGDRAFIRLQEQILKMSEDYSIFVWDAPQNSVRNMSIMAESPDDFGRNQTSLEEEDEDEYLPRNSATIWKHSDLEFIHPACAKDVFPTIRQGDRTILDQPLLLTGRGVRLTLPLLPPDAEESQLAFTYCRKKSNGDLAFIALAQVGQHEFSYGRALLPVVYRAANKVGFISHKTIYGQVYSRLDMGQLDRWYGMSSLCGQAEVVVRVKTASRKHQLPDANNRPIELSDGSPILLRYQSLASYTRFRFSHERNGILVVVISCDEQRFAIAFGIPRAQKPWCDVIPISSNIELFLGRLSTSIDRDGFSSRSDRSELQVGDGHRIQASTKRCGAYYQPSRGSEKYRYHLVDSSIMTYSLNISVSPDDYSYVSIEGAKYSKTKE